MIGNYCLPMIHFKVPAVHVIPVVIPQLHTVAYSVIITKKMCDTVRLQKDKLCKRTARSHFLSFPLILTKW